MTISSQFSAIYINIFHKIEVQTVILDVEQVWTSIGLKVMTQNANRAVTNKRWLSLLFSRDSLGSSSSRFWHVISKNISWNHNLFLNASKKSFKGYKPTEHNFIFFLILSNKCKWNYALILSRPYFTTNNYWKKVGWNASYCSKCRSCKELV